MRVTVCGARGSTPAPGAAFIRTGGHTSCLALAHHDGPPVLLLDAGTGIRRVSALLHGAPFAGTIVLTHLHWDHTQGLPFFAAADRDDAKVAVLVPTATCEQAPVELLAQAMSPPAFPIRPERLRGPWRFDRLQSGPQQVEGFTIVARELPHAPDCPTMGLRICTANGPTIAYLPDHAPHLLGKGRDGVGALHPNALELARDVDVLIHDAHFTRDELAARPHFGHSCADYALQLAEAAGARSLLLFHHHPDRTDDAIDALLDEVRSRAHIPVDVAREGHVLDISPGGAHERHAGDLGAPRR